MVSIRQFARELGVAEGTVRAKIRNGQIPVDAVGYVLTRTGKRRPAIADPKLAAGAFAPGSQLSVEVVEARRRRDAVTSLREIARMYEALSRDLVRDKQLISRTSAWAILAELKRQTIAATPAKERRIARRVLEAFVARALQRIDAAPAGRPKWPSREEAVAHLRKRLGGQV